ncbi:hypothetical protein [Sphingopyxis sp.]|uniref:hypothetical protein n=1 Tax=Sphingopyxis sp. TaxID=1908224 RepID=UPI002E134DB1
MARRRHSAASRDGAAARIFRWLLLLIAGAGVGMLLGELAVGSRTGAYSGEVPSFSRLSSNPDAMVAQGEGAPPCLDCADSYGVGIRMRAARGDRMSDEFRELGAVELDPPAPADIDDGYRYGGRFPDPEPPAKDDATDIVETLPVTTDDGVPPPDETPPMPFRKSEP